MQWQSKTNNRYDQHGNIHHSWTADELSVIKSNHHKHTVGTHFNYGYMEIVSKEGYAIEILPKQN